MLRTTICCVFIVATAAVAWQRLDDSPIEVEHGTSLTWGSDGLVWGWFPVSGTNTSYVSACDPNAHPDEMWSDAIQMGERVDGAGCTFQWMEQPGFWGCGWHVEGDDTLSDLFYYYPNDGSGTVSIEAFMLGEGASIAYDPNRAYWATNYAVPGWIYCLTDDPHDGRSFWRYAIPGGWYVPDLELDEFYPDSGAIISDQTPHLAWSSSLTTQYRIQVSTGPSFTTNVIDEVVSSPDYHPTTELDNGVYYWRTASWGGGSWTWCAVPHSFDLQGGWQQLTDIPEDVEEGAIIAYDSGSFSDAYRSILVLPGGGQDHDHFWRYIIGEDDWVQLGSATGMKEEDGTCLTTRTPTQEGSPLIMAAFSNQGQGDVPQRYSAQNETWVGWSHEGDSLHRSDFPRPMTYSSMVIGADNMMYLFPGSTVNEGEDFYHVLLSDMEGGQAVVIGGLGVDAQAISGCDCVEVEYQLPAAARVRATLHDVMGRVVSHLDAGQQQAGTHRLRWDSDKEGRRLGAGTYFVQLETGPNRTSLKVVIR